MTDITTTIKHFASLNRAPGPTWTAASKRNAPHKPLLLLAVLGGGSGTLLICRLMRYNSLNLQLTL